MSENNVTGIIGAEVTTTGIIGATVAIGQYIVNDYVITIAPVEDDYGYTMTITRGTEVQTISLYGLTPEQYNAMLGYLEQAQAAAQNAAGSASDAFAYLEVALDAANRANIQAGRAEQASDTARSYASQAQTAKQGAETAKTDAQTARTQAHGYRQAAEAAATRAETAATRAETSAEEITGMTAEAETLEPGSPATASFLDGVLSLGIPAGANGAAGNGIVSIVKTGTSGNIDTYTITYTNGTTSTFTVRNGVDGAVTSVAGKTGAVTLDAGDVAFDDQETYNDGTVGAGLTNLLSAITQIEESIYVDDLDKLTIFGNYYISSDGTLEASNNWRAYQYNVNEFTALYAELYSNSGSQKAIGFYSDTPSDLTYLSGIRFDRGTLITAGYRKFVTIKPPASCKYVLLTNRNTSGTPVIKGIEAGAIKTIETRLTNAESDIDEISYATDELFDAIKSIVKQSPNVKKIFNDVWNANDFVMIDGEFWFAKPYSLEGDNNEYLEIRRYKDVNGVLVNQGTTIYADFGHWNCVDYCEATDCLIFGNGGNSTSTEGNWFAVVPHPKNITGTTRTNPALISNVGIKYSVDIGYKVQAVWGDENLGQYNVAYVFANNATVIKKYLLKKTNGNFNGEFVAVVNETQSNQVGVGGAKFWGNYLYIGDNNHQICKMNMTDYGTEDITRHYYDADGNVLTGAMQGVWIDNNYLWLFFTVSGDPYLIQYCR